MSSFGKKSARVLEDLHPQLQRVLCEAIKSDYFDFSIMEGIRPMQRQQELYDGGESKALPGESAHNYTPSLAVDITPYPSGYKDGQAMLLLAGHIISTAERLGVELTCGCDWDRDGMVIDTNFKDFWHFEIKNWKELT
jgi:hypothetical protein